MQTHSHTIRHLAGVVLLSILFTYTVSGQYRGNRHGYSRAYPGALAISFVAGSANGIALNGPMAACDCSMGGGFGLGFTGGATFDIFLNRSLTFRLQGLFEHHAVTHTRDVTFSAYDQEGVPVQVAAQRRVEAGISYAATSMHMLWNTGAGGLYFSGGAGAGFFLDGTFRDRQILKNPGVQVDQESNSVVFYDGDLDAISDPEIRASLLLGIGYNLPLSRGMTLAPEIQIDAPISSITRLDTDWRILVVRTSIALRFGI